jgi:hypothetical protein
LQGLFANFIWVTSGFRVWCVFAIAIHASESLCASYSLPGFVLPFCLVTMWTFFHVPILAH